MKAKIGIVMFALLTVGSTKSLPQRDFPKELPREYVPAEELVVLSSSLEMKDALDILSEYAIEYAKKPIFNPLKSQGPIGIDVKSLPWMKALEVILSKHGLWYVERDHFFEVVRVEKSKTAGGLEKADYFELDGGKEIRLGVREVKIEAIFFKADRKKLFEWGIDWSTFKNGKISVQADQFGSLPLSDELLNVLVAVPQSVAQVDVTALLRSFDSINLGEVIAQPQVVVTEGQEGFIQVGQDFSIKTRDFAGNIIDRFFSTGTIMKVTPYVLDEKNQSYIFLNIHVERSTAHPDVISTIIKKSEANSFVELFNGEQTLIAGLYSNENQKLRKGVPLLKDLPWWFFGVRYLFGFFRNETVQEELVILLKATVLPDVRTRRTSTSSSSLELNQKPAPPIKDVKESLEKSRQAMQKVDPSDVKKYVSKQRAEIPKEQVSHARETIKPTDGGQLVAEHQKGVISLIRKGLALVDMGDGFNADKMVGRELIVFRKNGHDYEVNQVGKLRIIKAKNQLAAGQIVEERKSYHVQKGDFIFAALDQRTN